MNDADVIIACQQSINRFFQALDGHDFRACAALMAPDGVWHRKGNPLIGPDAVMADLSTRGPQVVSIHMVTNCVVTPGSPSAAEARYYALVYRCDNHMQHAVAPAPLTAPVSILVYEDKFSKIGGEWLVSERRSRRIFAI